MYRLLTLALLPSLLALAPSASRAETFDTCAGFITSLPAVISTQGTWCMKEDLSTTLATGAAISIAANNVTLDCNGYKLGGLAAGPGSNANGISALNRLNATIRNCNIRGFSRGIALSGDGGGHLVEHNRLDGNLFTAILVWGDNSVVRDNRALDTGGSANANFTRVIETFGSVDILDNLVAGAVPGACCTVDGNTTGIQANSPFASLIAGNRVHGLTRREAGSLVGIKVGSTFGGRPQVRDNHIVGSDPEAGTALDCQASTISASGNYLAGYANAFPDCLDHGGNIVN